MIEAGVNPLALAKLMGHADLNDGKLRERVPQIVQDLSAVWRAPALYTVMLRRVVRETVHHAIAGRVWPEFTSCRQCHCSALRPSSV